MTKNGGKRKKKRGNKGTSPGDSPPPISETLNILRETRDMMDQMHSNGDHSYQTNSSNVNYATNMSTSPNTMTNNMCSVNNTPGFVNNTQCVMPQTDDPHQHYMANMTNISSNFNANNQPGNAHAHYPYAAQTPPGGQPFYANGPVVTSYAQPGSNTVNTSESQGIAHKLYTMTGDPGKPQAPTPQNTRPPSPPAYTSTIYNMLKGIEYTLGKKLSDIEAHLQGQDKKWESVEAQLQGQNSRMINIEQQLSQMNVVKASVSNTNSKVMQLDKEVSDLKTKVFSYEESITSYSNCYDDLISSNTESNSQISDLLGRVENLEEIHTKTENRLIDLQWRSMRENLIFTGIKEPNLQEGEYEDVEYTLKTFLKQNMKIDRYIELDRVHRLGRFDPYKDYPRPIIAKFERFKDKEYVRQSAPETLINTQYGVREQYPYGIEEKRKQLYPIAKKARQDKDNKVRLVRDKLFINGQEVRVDETKGTKISKPATYRNNEHKNSDIIRSRIVYGKRRTNFGKTPRRPDTNFETPIGNRFDMLSNLKDSREITNPQSTQRKSTKNKASSPVDQDMTFKKYREGQSENTDSDSESDINLTLGTEKRDTSLKVTSVDQSPCKESSVIIDIDTTEATSNGVQQNAASDVTNTKSYSELVVQETPSYDEHANIQPTYQKAPSETNMTSSPKPGHPDGTPPSAKPLQMPGYAEASRELYYGPPPVFTQPVASPPLFGTDNPLNTQNMTLQSSEPVRRDSGYKQS